MQLIYCLSYVFGVKIIYARVKKYLIARIRFDVYVFIVRLPWDIPVCLYADCPDVVLKCVC